MSAFLGCFASDNFATVSEEIMQYLQEINKGHAPSYGSDSYTALAKKLIQQEFEEDCEVFFVFNGTGANVASLTSMTSSFHSIICADTAHIQTQETGSIYAHSGCKLLLIRSLDGKIKPDQIVSVFNREKFWKHHATEPKVVTISQSTEYGTIYTLDEIQAISSTCKELGLFLHVDGCRLYNAAVALNCPLKALGKKAGIDVLSLGGTKNGLMCAEAVVFFNRDLAAHFPYYHKQTLQLASKMRYISGQFIPFFKEGLWKKNAKVANGMTELLAEGLKQFPKLLFAQKVETNQIFLRLPKEEIVRELRKKFLFHVWNDIHQEIRLITAFDTQEKEVKSFIEEMGKLLS